jgi:hypothetical protein
VTAVTAEFVDFSTAAGEASCARPAEAAKIASQNNKMMAREGFTLKGLALFHFNTAEPLMR